MHEDNAFIEAIRKAPNELAPWLKFADWLSDTCDKEEWRERVEGQIRAWLALREGDPAKFSPARTEFILTQLELAESPETDQARIPLEQRFRRFLVRSETNHSLWVDLCTEVGRAYAQLGGVGLESITRDNLSMFRGNNLTGNRLFVYSPCTNDSVSLHSVVFERGFPIGYCLNMQAVGRGAEGMTRVAQTINRSNLPMASIDGYVVAPDETLHHRYMSAEDILAINNPHLRELEFGKNVLDEAGLHALAKNPHLESLRVLRIRQTYPALVDRTVGDAFVASPYLKQLQTLEIDIPVTDRGMRRLIKAFPNTVIDYQWSGGYLSEKMDHAWRKHNEEVIAKQLVSKSSSFEKRVGESRPQSEWGDRIVGS